MTETIKVEHAAEVFPVVNGTALRLSLTPDAVRAMFPCLAGRGLSDDDLLRAAAETLNSEAFKADVAQSLSNTIYCLFGIDADEDEEDDEEDDDFEFDDGVDEDEDEDEDLDVEFDDEEEDEDDDDVDDDADEVAVSRGLCPDCLTAFQADGTCAVCD